MIRLCVAHMFYKIRGDTDHAFLRVHKHVNLTLQVVSVNSRYIEIVRSPTVEFSMLFIPSCERS